MVTELSDEELLAGSEWPEGDADGCELILTDGKKKIARKHGTVCGGILFFFLLFEEKTGCGRVIWSSWSCPVILVVSCHLGAIFI
jgi:hypothetical protein